MTLTKNAQKLLAWLGLYKITASEYYTRIAGAGLNDYFYNNNWFVGTLTTAQGARGRIRKAPNKGSVFGPALAELVTKGY